MAAALKARLIANGLCIMRMSTNWQVPMDRTYFINPGKSIDVGDRKLTALRPPLYDNPMATGFHDGKGNMFAVDSFGAIIPGPLKEASEVPAEALAGGMTAWASADSPWVHMVDSAKFNRSLDEARRLAPKVILSVHLPPARNMTEKLLSIMAAVPTSTPFVAPNQAAFEQLMAQMKGGAPAHH